MNATGFSDHAVREQDEQDAALTTLAVVAAVMASNMDPRDKIDAIRLILPSTEEN